MRDPSTVRLLAPVAIDGLIGVILEEFAQRSEIAVDVTFDLNPNISPRILSGESFDVGITNPRYVEDLITAGHVDTTSNLPFGRFPLAIGIAGDRSPVQKRSLEEICDLLRKARSIAYTADGTSGKTFLGLLRHLGLLEEIATKLVAMGPGYEMRSPAKSVVSGKVEVAIAPLTTLIATMGINSVGQFPSELGTDIEMSVFLNKAGVHGNGPQALMQFLTDPSRDAVLSENGLLRTEPPKINETS